MEKAGGGSGQREPPEKKHKQKKGTKSKSKRREHGGGLHTPQRITVGLARTSFAALYSQVGSVEEVDCGARVHARAKGSTEYTFIWCSCDAHINKYEKCHYLLTLNII